ncbi:MAG: hypothetical protein RJB66_2673 [Pseudomonadota bacterium]|jgi:hypothetical protein
MRALRWFSAASIYFLSSVLLAMDWEIPSSGVQVVQVRARAAKVVVEKNHGSTIRVSISGLGEQSWQHELQTSNLLISGPEDLGTTEETKITLGIPDSITQTQLVFEDIRADLKSVSRLVVTALKGRISVSAAGENVKFFMEKGEIISAQHLGSMEIESYGGKITINDGQGPLKIRLFGGDLAVTKSQGSINLESNASSAKINGLQGNLSLLWGKGTFQLMDFSGRFEGVSRDGQLQLQLKPEAMVDLQAERGKVNINLPSDSGAAVNVRTVSGSLSVPGPIKSGREGRFRVARGKLVGASKGSITIRSDDASVGIR